MWPFAYDVDHPILRGISLSVKPGQTVALVGGTGAGKTTLLSLVPRFYDPNSGVVRIDGLDVREVTKKSLRGNISVVLQDTLLLSGTVLENISYGRPGATRAEIEAAAEAAQAHTFIKGCRMSTRRRWVSAGCAERRAEAAHRAGGGGLFLKMRRFCRCWMSRRAR